MEIAQKKANDTKRKLHLVGLFKDTHQISLSGKLMQKLDPIQFEMAYRMSLLEKKFHLAQISISACWKGTRTRRILRFLFTTRKWAIIRI